MEKWQNPETFALSLGVMILVVLLLTLFVYVLSRLYTKRLMREQKERSRLILSHQKSLAHALVDAQEKERGRIAADLHDDLVTKLRAIHLMLITENDKVEKNPIDLLKQSIELTREISHDLMPPMIGETPVDEIIEEALFLLKSNHDIEYQILGCLQMDMGSDEKLQLFRIIKEVINNICKHANATKVNVLIRFSKKYFALSFADNGVGISEISKGGGLGMKSIELRAQKINAKIKFKNQNAGGSKFLFVMPQKN